MYTRFFLFFFSPLVVCHLSRTRAQHGSTCEPTGTGPGPLKIQYSYTKLQISNKICSEEQIVLFRVIMLCNQTNIDADKLHSTVPSAPHSSSPHYKLSVLQLINKHYIVTNQYLSVQLSASPSTSSLCLLRGTWCLSCFWRIWYCHPLTLGKVATQITVLLFSIIWNNAAFFSLHILAKPSSAKNKVCQ